MVFSILESVLGAWGVALFTEFVGGFLDTGSQLHLLL